MKISKTKFKNLYIYQGNRYLDNRGEFRELIKQKNIKKKIIFTVYSRSKKNVLRGLHMQKKNTQDKFITVLKGKILDVVVDCRKKSKTFGKHFKIILSDKNCKSLYIPAGFAHGFLSLDNDNYIVYGCSAYRDKKSEISIKWNDPYLKINWGIKRPILSFKDKDNFFFKNIKF
tara:strand:+ start:4774 stop:5292 length:519 start_codon:yes stop_codon:yes gene_type:complete